MTVVVGVVGVCGIAWVVVVLAIVLNGVVWKVGVAVGVVVVW